ncbi:MAG: TIGR04086 family membrane protein [Cellulosilyticaceae bacterium]
MNKHKHSKKMQFDIPVVGMTLLKANVMAFALTAIFIIFTSIMLTYTNIGPSFEKAIVMVGCMAAAFLVGFDTAKVDTRNGYKWGAIGGISYLVIFLIIAALTQGMSALNMGYLFTLAILIVLSSGIAGMISVNSQK